MGRSNRNGSRAQDPATSSCRIVQRLYARPMTLRDAVEHLAQGVEGVTDLLIRPGDLHPYTDQFLSRTLVAFEAPPPVRQQAWRLSQRFSQEQVVLHAVDMLVASNSNNVLRNGFEKKVHGSRSSSSSSHTGLSHAQLVAQLLSLV